MLPTEINENLRRDVIGQEEVLRFVSVAIFKHLEGERYGNLMLIGNSGTGKTTVMRAMERLYQEHDEFSKYRVVIIMNANTFATEEGVVDTTACSSVWKSERGRSSAMTPPPSRSASTWNTPPSVSTRSTRSPAWSAASPTSPASTSSRRC